MKPQSGYYRNIIGDAFPNVRIAFTHTPMHNVSRVPSENIIELLKKSDDQFAQYYVEGLSNGLMVTIVENESLNTYLRAGELYFKY